VIRVGLVDADPLILEGRELALNAQTDMRVVYTGDSAQQVTSDFEDLLIDVFVVDQRLQGTAGVDLISKLSRQAFLDGGQTKFVLTAAFSSESLRAQALASGATAVVSQEQPVEELIHACRTLGGGYQYVHFDEIKALAASFEKQLATQTKLQVAIDALTAAPRNFLNRLLHGQTPSQIASDSAMADFRVRKNIEVILQAVGSTNLEQALFVLLANEVTVEQ